MLVLRNLKLFSSKKKNPVKGKSPYRSSAFYFLCNQGPFLDRARASCGKKVLCWCCPNQVHMLLFPKQLPSENSFSCAVQYPLLQGVRYHHHSSLGCDVACGMPSPPKAFRRKRFSLSPYAISPVCRAISFSYALRLLAPQCKVVVLMQIISLFPCSIRMWWSWLAGS